MGLSELEEELEKIENRLFLVEMIDRWTNEDILIYHKLMLEKKKIEQEIKQQEIGKITMKR